MSWFGRKGRSSKAPVRPGDAAAELSKTSLPLKLSHQPRNSEPGDSENPGLVSLDKNVPEASHSVRRINRIARHMNARAYLEIGVSRGLTFNRIEIESKVGVDPRFRFDIADYKKAGIEFHAITSDQYFVQFVSHRKFDVIFIDGLHRFHQVFRDFCNSLLCAHDRTIWLIDDVIPVDVYSALPVQQDAIGFRRSCGGRRSPAWQGDVFKLIFAIHDFFPMMSYVTLVGKENPQAIVWKTPRANFTPIFNKLETIERLGYFDMLKREEILNAKSEEEGFNDFFASIARQNECSHQTAGTPQPADGR